MGRYATIQENDVKCSGMLAEAIHTVIGQERSSDWMLSLTYSEVHSVMSEMSKMGSENTDLIYQNVQNKIIGFRKLLLLMDWYAEADINDTLTFC